MCEVCRVLLDKVAIPDGQNFRQKLQALAVIKSKFLVNSVEGSPVVVANLLAFINLFPYKFQKIKNCRY